MLVLRRTSSSTRFSSSSSSSRVLQQRRPYGQQPQQSVALAAVLSSSTPGVRRLHDCRSSTLDTFPRLPLSSSSSSSRFSTKAAWAPPEAIPLATLLSTLPPPRSSCLTEIQQHLARQGKGKGKKLVIVDDDPTGTQSVRGFPVLAEWTPEALAREIEDESTPGFFLLSNIRAMAPTEAGAVLKDIRQGMDEALKRLGRPADSITVISRSDSTLRGHFPLDVELLCPSSSSPKGKAGGGGGGGGGGGKVLTLVAPYFEAGGRLTINDVHYMTTTPSSLLPVHLTPFAHDKAFGFKTSNLKDWVEQKLSGQVQASDVASITLDDIRRGGPAFVRDKLLTLSRSSSSSSSSSSTYVVVNAVTRSDLECAVLGSLMAEDAEEEGARIVYRTAADWVAIRAGLPPLPPLPASAFHATPSSLPPSGPPSAKGGLVVVGSYVPKSSEQLACLLEGGQAEKIEGVEVSVDTLLESEAQRQAEVKRVTAAIELETNKGKDVVVYTTRQLRQEDGAGGLLSGMTVSESLVQIVKDLKTRPHFLIAEGGITSSDVAVKALSIKVDSPLLAPFPNTLPPFLHPSLPRPHFLIAKGGITSNDVAVKALGIKRAMVLGPILPGVPVWECGAESKFPGMKYVVFPGNVGSPQALLDAVQKLTHYQASSSPAPSSSSSSPTRPLFIPSSSSRTLDLVEAARAKGQAVGAFNVYNLEGVRAVVLAAAATDSSAILQVHPSSFDFGGAPLLELCRAARLYLEAGGRAGGKEGGNRIAVHLDHAHEAESIERVLALDLVDSVMCDGSALPYEENVAWTAKMTRLAHSKGVPVEAELGRLAGEEDGLSVAEKEAKMTEPAQVPNFVARTGVDLVAVTIGNVHGRYATNPPVLDLQRLADIRKVTDRPLVLHGASGLPPSLVHATMKIGGVCKFNVNTEVREAAMRVVREGKAKDVLPLMMATGEAMQAVIEEKMRLFKPTL